MGRRAGIPKKPCLHLTAPLPTIFSFPTTPHLWPFFPFPFPLPPPYLCPCCLPALPCYLGGRKPPSSLMIRGSFGQDMFFLFPFCLALPFCLFNTCCCETQCALLFVPAARARLYFAAFAALTTFASLSGSMWYKSQADSG